MHTRIPDKVIGRQNPYARETDWYVDFAATKHFLKSLRNWDPRHPPINAANSEIIRFSGTQEDVSIYAPELNANFLSVGQLINVNEDGYGRIGISII